MAYQLVQAKPISYGGTRALSSVKYIVIHYTAGNGDTAMAECRYFANGNTRAAGAHFFVDQAGNVVQSIPINRSAWSVGGFYTKANGAGSYYNVCTNFNSVSIELCDNLNKDPSAKQTSATKTLVAYIKSQCPNAKTIIRHWDVNGKLCPARMAGSGNAKWNSFRAAINGGTGWQKIGGVWYYFNSNGVMQTGWLKDGGVWYYLKSDGVMATGWVKVKGVWYYLKSSGAMATGWIKDGGVWYYLKSSGAMATGWQKVDGVWYYLKSDGAMATGWLKDGGKWYYLKGSGAMAIGWEKVNGKWYYLTSSGAMATGWLKDNNKWYYLSSSGAMVTGTVTIDGKKYTFNSSGALVE